MKKKAHIYEKIKKFNNKIIVPGDKSISIRLFALIFVERSVTITLPTIW